MEEKLFNILSNSEQITYIARWKHYSNSLPNICNVLLYKWMRHAQLLSAFEQEVHESHLLVVNGRQQCLGVLCASDCDEILGDHLTLLRCCSVVIWIILSTLRVVKEVRRQKGRGVDWGWWAQYEILYHLVVVGTWAKHEVKQKLWKKQKNARTKFNYEFNSLQLAYSINTSTLR